MSDQPAAAVQQSKGAHTFDVVSLIWLVATLVSSTTVLLFLLQHQQIKQSLPQQNVALLISSGMFVAGLFGVFGPRRCRPTCRTFPLILAGAGLLFIGAIAWNKLFIDYCNQTTYRREVFRKANYNIHAPLYGLPVKSVIKKSAWIPAAIAVGMACWLAWRPRERLKSKALVWQLIVFQIAMATAIGYYSVQARKGATARIMERMSATTESRTFRDVGDLLQRYVSIMPRLSVKSRHYPPGNLMLQVIEVTHGPKYLVLSLGLLLPALSLLPLRGLCRELEFSSSQAGMAMILYATSAGILVFPSISPTCMMVFLLAMCIWLLVRALRQGESWAAALLGVFFAAYMFWTFATYMVAILLGLLTLLGLCCRLVSLGRVLKVMAISIGVYVACFWLLYLVSGFNIIACFRTALQLHLEQTGPGFDVLSRYLFRSTGGILAYLISAGLPMSVLAYASMTGVFRERVAFRWAGVFCLSVTSAIVLAGFSGMSFLETERIWLFFCIPLAAAAGFELGRRVEQERLFTFHGTVCLALVQACCYGIFFDQMLGRARTNPSRRALVSQIDNVSAAKPKQKTKKTKKHSARPKQKAQKRAATMPA